jgi:hypothetical protein
MVNKILGNPGMHNYGRPRKGKDTNDHSYLDESHGIF